MLIPSTTTNINMWWADTLLELNDVDYAELQEAIEKKEDNDWIRALVYDAKSKRFMFKDITTLLNNNK